MDSNFRAFWLAPVTRNILGYSLFCERKEKWRVVSRKFQKKKLKQPLFYPSDLVNTKTTIPLRVGEERWIYTSTFRVSVYIHHYSPPLRGIVVYYTLVTHPFIAPVWQSLSSVKRQRRVFSCGLSGPHGSYTGLGTLMRSVAMLPRVSSFSDKVHKITRWSGDAIWRTGKKNFNAISHNRARP